MEPGAIVTAWEADGSTARPDVSGATAAIEAIGVPVWGLRRDWLEAPGTDERAAAHAAGLAGWAREDADVWAEDFSRGAAA